MRRQEVVRYLPGFADLFRSGGESQPGPGYENAAYFTYSAEPQPLEHPEAELVAFTVPGGRISAGDNRETDPAHFHELGRPSHSGACFERFGPDELGSPSLVLRLRGEPARDLDCLPGGGGAVFCAAAGSGVFAGGAVFCAAAGSGVFAEGAVFSAAAGSGVFTGGAVFSAAADCGVFTGGARGARPSPCSMSGERISFSACSQSSSGRPCAPPRR